LNWSIWARDEVRYVGFVQATWLPDRSALIAYRLVRDAWGKGYAREAATAMLAHMRIAWDVSEFIATVDARNKRSIATLEALGFSPSLLHAMPHQADLHPSDEMVYTLRAEPR
jgi:[ribosomal protein S5]-alanine N-acetyltransferase